MVTFLTFAHIFDGSHPDVFSLGTINNKSFPKTQLVYYFFYD